MEATRAVSGMAHGSKAKCFNYLREGRIKQLEKRSQPPRYGWRQSSDPGYVKRRNLGAFTFLKRLHVDWFKSAESRNMMLQRCGVTVISRRAWMRASSGGCVLKREDSVPLPKSGLTMQSAEVDGESAVVGIRWL